MSKRTRTLIIGATLAAMNLVGMTAVAHAQATNEAKDARRPPTERQVGETWRHGQAATPEQTAADAALQRQLARERHSIPSRTPAQVPAPVPDEPSGTPGWLVASLGAFGCRPGAGGRVGRARRQTGRPQSPSRARGLTRSHGHAARWGCRAHRQPHRHPSLLSHRPAVPLKRSSSSSGPSAHVVSSACGVLVILRSMLSSAAIPAGRDLIPQRIRE